MCIFVKVVRKIKKEKLLLELCFCFSISYFVGIVVVVVVAVVAVVVFKESGGKVFCCIKRDLLSLLVRLWKRVHFENWGVVEWTGLLIFFVESSLKKSVRYERTKIKSMEKGEV